jgi:hypothetical protein
MDCVPSTWLTLACDRVVEDPYSSGTAADQSHAPPLFDDVL